MQLRSSLFAFLAAFLALFSASAVPQGMMPHWGVDGFSVILCSPENGERMEINRDAPEFETLRMIEKAKRLANGHAPTEQEQSTEMQPCSVGGGNSDKSTLPLAVFIAALSGIDSLYSDNKNYNIALQHRRHLPPSTGPPSEI